MLTRRQTSSFLSQTSVLSAIVLLLLATLLSNSAFPAQKIKPGTSCKTLNSKVTQSGKLYACIKKGKKLVWNNGVAIKSAAPAKSPATSTTPTPVVTPSPSVTPAPSATPTPPAVVFQPWSTDIDAKLLSDEAQKNFLAWAKQRTNSKINHTQRIQENNNSQRISIMKKADDLSAQLFSEFFPKGSITVIGATENWAVSELAKSGWTTSTCNNPYMSGVFLCLDNDSRQGYVVTADATYDARNPGNDGGALLAHEYFHLVQWNLSKTTKGIRMKSGDASSANAFPAWFVEGSADFVGYSVGALSQNASYWEGRARMLSYSPPGESVNRNSITDYEIRTCCGNDTPTYPYNIGQVATEYIVASIGFQKFLDIWTSFAITQNFEKSFESIAGISKETFYEKFDQIRTKVGLPGISWKLDGLVNKKIGG